MINQLFGFFLKRKYQTTKPMTIRTGKNSIAPRPSDFEAEILTDLTMLFAFHSPDLSRYVTFVVTG